MKDKHLPTTYQVVKRKFFYQNIVFDFALHLDTNM